MFFVFDPGSSAGILPFEPTRESIFPLGNRLNVTYPIFSVTESLSEKENVLEVALFDKRARPYQAEELIL